MKIDIFTIPAKLTACCKKFAKKPAFLLKNGKTISYLDMNWDIFRTARILREQGISKHSKVVLFIDDNPQTIETFFAITRLGAVALLLDKSFTPEQITSIISKEKPEAIFTNELNTFDLPEDCNASILDINDNKILKNAKFSMASSDYIIRSSDPAAIKYEIDGSGLISHKIITQKEVAAAKKVKKSKEAKCKNHKKVAKKAPNKLVTTATNISIFAKILTGRCFSFH